MPRQKPYRYNSSAVKAEITKNAKLGYHYDKLPLKEQGWWTDGYLALLDTKLIVDLDHVSEYLHLVNLHRTNQLKVVNHLMSRRVIDVQNGWVNDDVPLTAKSLFVSEQPPFRETCYKTGPNWAYIVREILRTLKCADEANHREFINNSVKHNSKVTWWYYADEHNLEMELIK